jgi:ribosomal protein S18 acetylase RimI-like enzyme
MRAAMDKHHPSQTSHLYLWLLGVRPQAQGAGVGSRLLRAGLERADALTLPVFLETATTRNVALYRRHGFEVLAEYRAREDAPLSWAMWREPNAG